MVMSCLAAKVAESYVEDVEAELKRFVAKKSWPQTPPPRGGNVRIPGDSRAFLKCAACIPVYCTSRAFQLLRSKM